MERFLFVPFRAFFPIEFLVSLVDFNVIFFRFLLPLNALAPILFSVEDLISTDFNFVQFLNAFFPIEVTFFPIVTEVAFLLPENALSAILVTLYVTLSMVTVSGTLIVVS